MNVIQINKEINENTFVFAVMQDAVIFIIKTEVFPKAKHFQTCLLNKNVLNAIFCVSFYQSAISSNVFLHICLTFTMPVLLHSASVYSLYSLCDAISYFFLFYSSSLYI